MYTHDGSYLVCIRIIQYHIFIYHMPQTITEMGSLHFSVSGMRMRTPSACHLNDHIILTGPVLVH